MRKGFDEDKTKNGYEPQKKKNLLLNKQLEGWP